MQAYQATPKDSTDAMFDHLFANLPEALEEQKDSARRWANGQGTGH